MEITFFNNGNTMAIENNEQVSEVQKSWLVVFAEYLSQQGINPATQIFVLPGGRTAKIFETENGYNWSLD